MSRDPPSRSVTRVVASRLVGLIIFLVILWILILLIPRWSGVYPFIEFFNENIWLIVLFSFLFLIGEAFTVLGFPLSLPAPLFNALGAVFLVSFLFRLLFRIDGITGTTNFLILEPMTPLIYLALFLLVLIIGYVEIFSRATSTGPERLEGSPPGAQEPAAFQGGSQEGDVTWERIGSEFRQLLYDMLHAMRDAIRGNR